MSTLKELRSTISANVAGVDDKPYSHNIISLTLRQIAEDHGLRKPILQSKIITLRN